MDNPILTPTHHGTVNRITVNAISDGGTGRTKAKEIDVETHGIGQARRQFSSAENHLVELPLLPYVTATS